MARPKSYNRAEALERACHAFWQHGYGALGVRMIEEKTGLNQFAIRTEFGGKEGLFLEALKFYSDQAQSIAFAPLKNGGIVGIKQFFENFTNSDSPIASMWGCLIVNTGVENAKTSNPKFSAISKNYWQVLNAHFLSALRHAQDSGELMEDVDIAEASNALVIAIMGIHTMNRVSGSSTAGAPMVAMVQGWLKNWGAR